MKNTILISILVFNFALGFLFVSKGSAFIPNGDGLTETVLDNHAFSRCGEEVTANFSPPCKANGSPIPWILVLYFIIDDLPIENSKFLKTGSLLCFSLVMVLPVSAQRIVKEYKIQNLISNVVLEKFQQINPDVEIYDHHEGNRLILVGDSLDMEMAMEQLKMLDARQMMVTIEFMLVEYFHQNNFEWGIDITQGTSGNFTNSNYSPGAQSEDLSFLYNAVAKLTPSFHVNIQALVNEDKAKVLTNPHLVVESGEEAELNIKDRRTVTLETATINGVTTTLQSIEAGIELHIIPIPTHNSLIHLDIQGIISEFLPFSEAGEFLVEENSINTNVDVHDGETLIIGGLITEETNTVTGGVPLLKDIPLLGLLFKKKREVTNYIERVMYITPYLHPIGELGEYENIRDLTPFEREVEEVIESDPGFLRYNNTKKAMRKNPRRRNNGNGSGNN